MMGGEATLLEAVEKLLDVRFGKLEDKLAEQWKRQEAVEDKCDRLLKLVTEGTKDVLQQLCQVEEQQEESRQKVQAVDEQVGEALKRLDRQEQERQKPDPQIKSVFDTLRAMDAKVSAGQAKMATIENKVNNVQNRLGKQQGQFHLPPPPHQQLQQQQGPVPVPAPNLSAPPPTAAAAIFPPDMLELVRAEVKDAVQDKFDELPDMIGAQELKELAPKVLQLQTNLDVLLTGESEANALIDKLLPTVTQLQKDVNIMSLRVESDMKKLREDQLPKLQATAEDCYDKIADVKSYTKDGLDLGEEIMEKLGKVQRPIDSRPNPRQRPYKDGLTTYYGDDKKTDDEDEQDGEKKKRDSSQARGGGGSDMDKIEVSAEGDMKENMLRLHNSMATIQKEIRRIDVMDLVEVRLIPNVLTIRKSLEDLIRFGPNMGGGYRGRGDHHHYQPRGGRSYPNQQYHRGGRGYYQQHHHHHQQRYFIPGTKWTYDEHGNREQASSDEEIEVDTPSGTRRSRSRSRSRGRGGRSRSRSRSRSPRSRDRDSRSPSRSSRNRKSSSRHRSSSKHRPAAQSAPKTSSKPREKRSRSRSSNDSEEHDIQQMEGQISKIALAVEEIQEKMDNWLSYSKKTIQKSDENTKRLGAKMDAFKAQMGRDVEEVMAKVSDIATTPAKKKRKFKEKKADSDSEEDSDAEDELDDNSKLLLEKVVRGVQDKLCEFGSLVEGLSTDQGRRLETLSNGLTPLSDQMSHYGDILPRLKSIDKKSKEYAHTNLQIAQLTKSIESIVTSVATKQELCSATLTAHAHENAASGGGGNKEQLQAVTALLREMQPKLDTVQVKVLPLLEDLKRNSETAADSREDSQIIRKILDIVEDLKENDRNSMNNLNTNANNIKQVFNALNELKNTLTTKEQGNFKLLGEIKGETSKSLSKLNDVIKSKATDKLLGKVYAGVEEVKKNSSTDSKTLSQMNTALQGLRAVNSANEAKLTGGLKEIKEEVQELTGPMKDGLAKMEELESGQGDVLKEVKEVKKLSKEDSASSKKKIADDLATTMGRILGCMEKKLMDNSAMDHRTTVGEVHKLVVEQVEMLAQNVNSVDEKAGKAAEAAKSAATAAEKAAKDKKSKQQDNVSVDTATLETLSEKLDDLETRLVSSAEQQSSVVLEQLSKQTTEVLNSVEDMKQLTSSTPNTLHDLIPKVDQVAKHVAEIPNDIGAYSAALEDNLCANLDRRIVEAHENTRQDMAAKFDMMEQRMAVIKKYAKHGPAAAAAAAAGTSGDKPAAQQQQQSSEAVVGSEGVRQLMEHISHECRVLADMFKTDDLRESLDMLQTRVVPLVDEIHTMDKQMLLEQAKGVVVEEQLEALAQTLMQPVQELKPAQDRLLNLVENDITDLLEQSLSAQPAAGSSGQSRAASILPSTLAKMEERILGGQKSCMQVVADEVASKADNLQKSLSRDIQEIGESTTMELAETITTQIAKIPAPTPVPTPAPAPAPAPAAPSKEDNAQTVRKLLECLQRVQQAQSDILRQSDRTIEYQSSLNTVFKQLVASLQSLRRGLAKKDDSSELPELCSELSRKISSLDELEGKLSAPRTQSCEDLRQLIQKTVTVLDCILKDKELVGVSVGAGLGVDLGNATEPEVEATSEEEEEEEDTPETEQEQAQQPETETAAMEEDDEDKTDRSISPSSFQNICEHFMKASEGEETPGEEAATEVDVVQQKKRARSSTGTVKGRAKGRSRPGPKRSKVQYVESEEEEEENNVMLKKFKAQSGAPDGGVIVLEPKIRIRKMDVASVVKSPASASTSKSAGGGKDKAAVTPITIKTISKSNSGGSGKSSQK